MKNIGLWASILFIIMPVAYYFAFTSFLLLQGGKVINYLIFVVSCAVIICMDVLLLKKIKNN